MLAGNGGTHEEFQAFLADMASVGETSMETPEVAEEEKGYDPMRAADSLVPEDWFFCEE